VGPQGLPASFFLERRAGSAEEQIEKLIDPSAPDEERQQRKRRLLKGPREFREMRDGMRSKLKS
jgi:hypothetical protein